MTATAQPTAPDPSHGGTPIGWTPYADVNGALAELTTHIQKVLGAKCVGIYLSGSLALGDFDPKSSDIDLVIVTRGALADVEIAALRAMHFAFDGGRSPWAGKVEAIYAAGDALRRPFPNPTPYP